MFYIGLYDPDNLILNFVIAKAMGLVLSLAYEFLGFKFHSGSFLMTQIICQVCTVVPVLVLAATGLYCKIVTNRRRPRRRRPRPNPVPDGPRTDPVSGPTAPPVQGQVPAIPGP
ncbi:uncharacterized protein LOC131332199 [Rhododendron vialii]|uniref:uncharacterized protein LOC131332199 n=1 Tax=Rhododendron vialii TaxID=182163 RepID=UPI00265E5AC3|nr:uncharacterized protein LOC131332199 [Rhododendron vialii]XP_058222262.1 uncharacterized protein LOC131332199 [Rhododendron vialii]